MSQDGLRAKTDAVGVVTNPTYEHDPVHPEWSCGAYRRGDVSILWWIRREDCPEHTDAFSTYDISPA